MKPTKAKNLLSKAALVITLPIAAAGCASTGGTESSEEKYVDAEKRLEEIRQNQYQRYVDYQYTYTPGLATQFQVFNNSYRANPDHFLGYDEDYNAYVDHQSYEDPVKKEQERELEREERKNEQDKPNQTEF